MSGGLSTSTTTRPGTDARAMIEFIDVHKTFGKQKVLDGLSLQVPKDQVTCIIGRSGTGKSVTLKHIMGLMKPDKGQVLVDGADVTRMKERELYAMRKRFGFLFQDAALFDSMSVLENVAFPLREHTKKSNKDVTEIVRAKLKIVGLTGAEQKLPSQLSGGMRKRVGLARAIALDPEIILFDEPTSGLDPVVTDAVDQMILSTQDQLHVTMVVITHDVNSMMKIADKIILLHQGSVRASGTRDQIRDSADPMVQQFLQGRSDGPMKVQ
jgi:phospholipid/cholesterol/gamma-HCH transport system ATP-binding protein